MGILFREITETVPRLFRNNIPFPTLDIAQKSIFGLGKFSLPLFCSWYLPLKKNVHAQLSAGFNPSILRHSVIWGAADEAVLNKVPTMKRKKISPVYLCKDVFSTKSIFHFFV